MKKHLAFVMALSLALSACGGQQANNAPPADSKDKQIAENAKEIELLKQQAEIQRLKNELNVSAASQAEQVYQLAASEVANTIPANLQEQAKNSGQPVQGTDGLQYMYDPDTGSWLLYGAIGAALGYMAANAMNNKNKYAPVSKPTAAVSRVYQDYQAKNPRAVPPPSAKPQTPNQPAVAPQNNAAKPTPNYKPTNQGYSNHQQPARQGGFGGFGKKRR